MDPQAPLPLAEEPSSITNPLDSRSVRWLSITVFMRYAALAMIWPHVARWMKVDIGISESTFALIFFSADVTSLLTQPLWGLTADRAQRRRSVLRVLVLGSGTAFTLLGIWGAQLPLAAIWLLMVVANILQDATLPILNSIVMSHLGPSRLHRFPYIRVMGSIGFMLVMFMAPSLLLDERFLNLPRSVLFIIGGLMSVGSVCLMRWKPLAAGPRLRPSFVDVGKMLRENRSLLFLYLAMAIFYLAYGGSMAFVGAYFAELKGTEIQYGFSWGFNVMGEIPVTLLAPMMVKRWGMKRLVVLAMSADSIRFLMVAFTRDPAVLSVVWALGGPPTVGYVVIIPMLIGSLSPHQLRSTAQNLQMSIRSLGNIAGLFLIHLSMSRFGGEHILDGYRMIFLRTSLGAAIAAVVVLLFVHERRDSPQAN